MTHMIEMAIALDGGNQHRILLPQVLFQAFQPLFDGFSCSGHQGFLLISSGNIPESNKFTVDSPGKQSVRLFLLIIFSALFASLR
jgi:hypothetical protein